MAEIYWVAAALDGDPEHPRDNFEVEQAERLAAEQRQLERHTDTTTGPSTPDEVAPPPRGAPEPATEQARRAR